jgi:signal transduction histidine kinase
VGLVEIAAPLLMQFARMTVAGEEAAGARVWQTAAMVLAGAITLALSAMPWSRQHARLLAGFSAWIAPTVLIWASLWKPSGFLGEDDYIPAAITLVVLAAVATVPLLPWHTLALGLAVEGMYILSCWFAARWEFPSAAVQGNAHHIFLVLLALLATGISATNYERYRAEFAATQESVRAAEALTGAQLRAQLAENAISIGKMAAALSHEINSPLGTLRSSVETLLALTDRMVNAPPDKRALLEESRVALSRSIEESATRIDEVTRRLRRFVNLEEAEMKSADINDLLSDVTLLHQDEIHNAGILLQFDLEPSLPPLNCRPQLLSAVFSSLLSNAIHAVNGDGRIDIATRMQDLDIAVTIRDNGKGMRPEEVETIFDPSFKVAGSRVSSGNWSLFNTRQIVYEHGGEINVETAEGKGTAVHVTLPLVSGR